MIQRSRQASHFWLGKESRIDGGGTGARGIDGIAFSAVSVSGLDRRMGMAIGNGRADISVAFAYGDSRDMPCQPEDKNRTSVMISLVNPRTLCIPAGISSISPTLFALESNWKAFFLL